MKYFYKERINGFLVKYYFAENDKMLELLLESLPEKDRAEYNYSPEGLFFPRELKIYINQDQCYEQKRSSILHERIEAMNYLYDLQLSHHQIIQLECALFNLGWNLKNETNIL